MRNICLFEDEVAIICNEEGKITGMAPNRAVYEENSREMQDIICGRFFIAYAPFDAERFQSLPPDLAEKYREKFKYPERFMRVNNEIVVVPFKPVRADKVTLISMRTGFPRTLCIILTSRLFYSYRSKTVNRSLGEPP